MKFKSTINFSMILRLLSFLTLQLTRLFCYKMTRKLIILLIKLIIFILQDLSFKDNRRLWWISNVLWSIFKRVPLVSVNFRNQSLSLILFYKKTLSLNLKKLFRIICIILFESKFWRLHFFDFFFITKFHVIFICNYQWFIYLLIQAFNLLNKWFIII